MVYICTHTHTHIHMLIHIHTHTHTYNRTQISHSKGVIAACVGLGVGQPCQVLTNFTSLNGAVTQIQDDGCCLPEKGSSAEFFCSTKRSKVASTVVRLARDLWEIASTCQGGNYSKVCVCAYVCVSACYFAGEEALGFSRCILVRGLFRICTQTYIRTYIHTYIRGCSQKT